MIKAYKRVDLQGAWGDRYYESMDEMREQLIELHSQDCTDEDENFLTNMTLDELCANYEWECLEVRGEWVDKYKHEFIESNN